MRWVAPTEKDTANQTLEKRLWDAACSIRGAKDEHSPPFNMLRVTGHLFKDYDCSAANRGPKRLRADTRLSPGIAPLPSSA